MSDEIDRELDEFLTEVENDKHSDALMEIEVSTRLHALLEFLREKGVLPSWSPEDAVIVESCLTFATPESDSDEAYEDYLLTCIVGKLNYVHGLYDLLYADSEAVDDTEITKGLAIVFEDIEDLGLDLYEWIPVARQLMPALTCISTNLSNDEIIAFLRFINEENKIARESQQKAREITKYFVRNVVAMSGLEIGFDEKEELVSMLQFAILDAITNGIQHGHNYLMSVYKDSYNDVKYYSDIYYRVVDLLRANGVITELDD